MNTAWPFLDMPHPLGFAHRGGARALPENSMAAFQQAVDLGFHYVETDVRATADGVLLAFHDATLDRVTGRPGAVASLPYAVVAHARIAGTEPIPRLRDVLDAWPDLRVNVDVKAANAVGPLLDELRVTGAWDRVLVAAFSDARIRVVRRAAGPRLATALGPREVAGLAALARAGRAGQTGRTGWTGRPPVGGSRFPVGGSRLPSGESGAGRAWPGLAPRDLAAGAAAVQVPERIGGLDLVDSRFVELAHRNDLEVHVWTVNDEAAMRRLLALGVDGLVSDDLPLLRRVLAFRHDG